MQLLINTPVSQGHLYRSQCSRLYNDQVHYPAQHNVHYMGLCIKDECNVPGNLWIVLPPVRQFQLLKSFLEPKLTEFGL